MLVMLGGVHPACPDTNMPNLCGAEAELEYQAKYLICIQRDTLEPESSL